MLISGVLAPPAMLMPTLDSAKLGEKESEKSWAQLSMNTEMPGGSTSVRLGLLRCTQLSSSVSPVGQLPNERSIAGGGLPLPDVWLDSGKSCATRRPKSLLPSVLSRRAT